MTTELERIADMLRTCEDGCNGCDDCTDWYDPVADDDQDATPEFGCCLPPGDGNAVIDV